VQWANKTYVKECGRMERGVKCMTDIKEGRKD
jgi:hypothetical protein